MKGTLEIIIARENGAATVYYGEAEWRTDEVTMALLAGPPLAGYDPAEPGDLEYHAAICRAAAWQQGLETEERWQDGFKGGRLR